MKSSLVFLIKIIASAVLLYLILSKIDWDHLAVSIKQGKILHLFVGVVIGFVFNVVKFRKWHYLINAGKHSHSFWDGMKSYMIGNALGSVTPMRAGDLGRSLYFSSWDRPRILGLTIVDRMLDLVAVLILCIGGSFILINKEFGLLLLFVGTFSLFTVYSSGFLYDIFRKNATKGGIREKLFKLMDILKILDVQIITVSLTLSFIAFAFTIVEFFFVVSAFEDISLLSTYLTTPLITLSALIPVTFMGLGVREGISILLFSKFGISAATAFSAAFLCFVINNLSISIIGVLYLSKIQLTAKG